MIVRVALPIPGKPALDYRCDEAGSSDLGRIVLAPLGKRRLWGVITSVGEETDIDPAKIRPILAMPRHLPPLPPTLLRLLRFVSDYYHVGLGEVTDLALPPDPGMKASLREEHRFRLSPAGQTLGVDHFPTRAHARRALWEALQQGSLQRSDLPSPQRTNLDHFIDQGWVEEDIPSPQAPLALNEEQAAAVATIHAANGFSPFLLFGITGSGKTEVYLQAMAAALEAEKQVLCLVPEINLTPQLELRFAQRFPAARRVNMHSDLAKGERLAAWLAAAGEADIVLGTRLAVFAPLSRLGLIIVDEEHDSSYKQQDGVRYSARDVAVARAHIEETPIILGSATPSMETFANAASGRYRRLDLTHRARSTPPKIEFLDLNREPVTRGFASPAIDLLREHFKRGEQSLVFINRRGFAPLLTCLSCGHQPECEHCSARLVVHRRDGQLRCHHCGYRRPVPTTCPKCGGAELATPGFGTQKIEETLAEWMPKARVLRIDRDTTQRKGAFRDYLAAIHASEVDILVGTQMLAKGHDLPKLTLVLAVNPDDALFAADFRAGERLFAQLMQVSGRAGRAQHAGRMVVQTRFPDHPLYQALASQDYAPFAERTLAERSSAGMPPSGFLAVLRADAEKVDDAIAFLQIAKVHAQDIRGAIAVLGPAPAAMVRLAGRERAQLLLIAEDRRALHQFLLQWLPRFGVEKGGKLRWHLDVDPLEI